ncbi:MAG: FmdB family zinc ribbon protein, partial [Thermodesulfobacteriota bacterium]
MPIYEYSCEKCKATFSVLQSVGSGDKGTRCTE